MLATARTFTLDGISARPVQVEVDVHKGLPNFTIVGLPDAAVREARERVRAALVNCGFEFPLRRIVVNLAPASLRKAGPGMDLAIAAALLSASGQLRWEGLARTALAGELALDGTTRPVPGVLAMAEAAREVGVEAVVVPAANGPEAALVDGVEVVAIEELGTLSALASGGGNLLRPEPLPPETEIGAPDIADLRGQPHLRHALEVAAAGGHSLLMVGPPGAGKSLAASRLPSILPPLGGPEALEVARIASACGRLGDGLPQRRPFRAPHHTISAAGLIGGGTPPRAGEATLAHRGVKQEHLGAEGVVRFPKLTRSLINNAKGKSVEIMWPQDGPEPKRGHTYTVQTRYDRRGAYSILVRSAFKRADGKWRAVVQVAGPQRPLRLKAKVAPDPTDATQFRPEYEPEQVDEDFQRLLDEEGERKTLQCQEAQRSARETCRRERRADRSNLRPAA